MSKVIIHNNSETLSDSLAVFYVSKVVDAGRISGDGEDYCYVTRWKRQVDGEESYVTVSARRNRSGSDTFVVWTEYD